MSYDNNACVSEKVLQVDFALQQLSESVTSIEFVTNDLVKRLEKVSHVENLPEEEKALIDSDVPLVAAITKERVRLDKLDLRLRYILERLEI